MRRVRLTTAAAILAACCAAVPLAAQEKPSPGWERVSFFTNASVNTPTDGGASTTFTELVTTAAIQSPTYDGDGTEYAADLRFAGYPTSEGRASRVSIYDAYVARRLGSGHLQVKAGQMWLNELGALGSVGGVLVEARQSKHADGSRWRAGGFAGLEPELLQAGYASGVRKAGAYVAYDGAGAQRDVLGFVAVRNQNLTERAVLLTNNFVPIGKRVFLYQSAEYDTVGPAGIGSGGLTYFFANARISPNDRLDIQGTYHRGRSIDVRTISTDTLNGRPVDQRSVEGLLFESIGGRVTATVAKGLRVYGGYARDQTNQGADVTGRLTFGASLSNLGSTGLDLTVSDSRTMRGDGSSYDAWYVSAGRVVGTRAYVSADYTTSLSVLSVNSLSSLQIHTNPRTQRFSASATATMTRSTSLLLTAEHTIDPTYTDNRILAGITWRLAR